MLCQREGCGHDERLHAVATIGDVRVPMCYGGCLHHDDPLDGHHAFEPAVPAEPESDSAAPLSDAPLYARALPKDAAICCTCGYRQDSGSHAPTCVVPRVEAAVAAVAALRSHDAMVSKMHHEDEVEIARLGGELAALRTAAGELMAMLDETKNIDDWGTNCPAGCGVSSDHYLMSSEMQHNEDCKYVALAVLLSVDTPEEAHE